MYPVGVGSDGDSRPFAPTPRVAACTLLTPAGDKIASGEALVEDDSGVVHATVQGLLPVGAVTAAIFGKGQRRFRLDLAGFGPTDVELTGSRFTSAGTRVCFFRSLDDSLIAGAVA